MLGRVAETFAIDADPAQLRALREAAAACAPQLRAAIAVSGPDHRDWLERLASNPIKALPEGRATGFTLMDGKGRLRGELRAAACGVPDSLLLDVPEAARVGLLKALDIYILREKVWLKDLSAEARWVHVLGPRAGEALRVLGLPAPHGDEALAGGVVLAALASRHFGAEGADLLVAAKDVAPMLARLQDAGVVPVERPALDAQRIARGVPWWPDDLSDAVIPLEAGLDADVSITKGCYPGQEVVARITNLGQVARKLLRLSAPGRVELAAGAPLGGTGERAGQEAGKVTSAAFDPLEERTLALGFLRRAFWPAGTVVRTGKVELEVAELKD
jgi:folate-binding protein YgfZ